MRLTRLLLLLFLLPISLIAGDNAAAPQTAPPKNTTRRSSAVSPKTKSAPAVVSAEQLKALQDALAAQERRIQQLEEQIQQRDQQWRQLQSQLQKTEASAAAADSRLSEMQFSSSRNLEERNSLQSDLDKFKVSVNTLAENAKEEHKRVSSMHTLLGKVRWFGDIRVQNVDYFLAGQNVRVRERIRVRIGMESPLGQDFVAGVGLATGNLGDETSGNAALTNFFQKKTFGLNLGYITYKPEKHKWLTLTGGKFAPHWQRTTQYLDGDIMPEGFSERLSFDINNNVLKNVTLQAMQLFFYENTAVKYGTSGIDSFAAGGQLLVKLKLHKRWTIAPSYTALNWHNENILMNAPAFSGVEVVSGTTGIVCNPVTALNTNPSCSFATLPYAPPGMTNAYKVLSVGSNGNVVRGFLSKFMYSNLMVDSTIDTGRERWPWKMTLEHHMNLRAASNNSHIYQLQTSLGQTKNKNDFLFGYGFLREEQDAAIAAFVEDDQRLPTNIVEHTFFAQWKAAPNVVLAYKLYVGRVLNSALFAPVAIPGSTKTDALQTGFLAPGVLPGQLDHYRKRMQFDLIYTF